MQMNRHNDKSYLEYIDKIKDKSTCPTKYDRKGCEVYFIKISEGTLIVKLSQENGEYLNLAFYQVWKDTRYVDPVGFTMSNPKCVYETFFGKDISFERVSYRLYGQPKLDKPKELKGIEQSFTGTYIKNKCDCPCFCFGEDLWVQHKDFFSRAFQPPIDDLGKPTSYYLNKYFNCNRSFKKFVYNDSWGSIILRNEAWIVFRNIKSVAMRVDYIQLAKLMLDTAIQNDATISGNLSGYTELWLQWERFFEDIGLKYQSYLKA